MRVDLDVSAAGQDAIGRGSKAGKMALTANLAVLVAGAARQIMRLTQAISHNLALLTISLRL